MNAVLVEKLMLGSFVMKQETSSVPDARCDATDWVECGRLNQSRDEATQIRVGDEPSRTGCCPLCLIYGLPTSDVLGRRYNGPSTWVSHYFLCESGRIQPTTGVLTFFLSLETDTLV